MKIVFSAGTAHGHVIFLVNDKKNSQRKGSAIGENQKFINLWTSISPLIPSRILDNFRRNCAIMIPEIVYRNIKLLCAGL